MPQDFTLLVDDQDPQINYICPSLKQQLLAGSYSNSTWTTIKESSCRKGWFEYSFFGTGIRIRVPTSGKAESAAVLLDNELFKPDENGVFEALDLKDGQHNFTYGIGEVSTTPVFDYLTVAAGPSTPLNGRTLIADDTDESINYIGSWTTESPRPLTFDYSTALYRDTAHWSSTIGDTVEFQFTGSSVAVYGLAANITSGNITASYTLDGVTTTQGIPRGTFDSVPMTEFFRAELQPGAHTLIVNLTEIASSQAFGIDFIAYNSSVDSIRSLPGFDLAAGNAATKSESDRAGSSNSQKYAILGGVLGAVGFLLLMGLAFFIFKRRQSKQALRLASSNSSYDDIAGVEKPPQTYNNTLPQA
ncbi:hypothetical protein CC1G_15025 [Coprinopsis cinerea okayama7|uniref:Uncharacterized protein n=1 Tax=Coprinopsis cinerea (strain Okayama-7 / 130 / ATCC MYA-4618 / FGSC 9003) TaxID=240176 RepID=D6RPD2_COPC7|nr:hypothetical protein CC1G_15025 [Coprinopsis cinerea okayama7\|eukprot:XP_002910694.1 hypothetical protein CC1G_15025 [Coprinopsis cinerea okayama7\